MSTFATINPTLKIGDAGTFGVAVSANGNVLVSNWYTDTRFIFPDKDGQTVASALYTISPSGSRWTGYASVGGQAYGAAGGDPDQSVWEFSYIVQFNDDGTVNRVLGTYPRLGMAGNFVNGHLIVNGYYGLLDIDPKASGGNGSIRFINHSQIGAGVAVSNDGKTAYVFGGDGSCDVCGLDIASGSVVYSSGHIFSGTFGGSFYDGLAVISSRNNLDGQLL